MDTLNSCIETINYSLQLNTYMARYSVCTPYPGTRFYSDLASKGDIVHYDPACYDQMSLVFRHDNLSQKQIKSLIQKAYVSYYSNPRKVWNIFTR